jgi:membrane-associated phospholipid phosphatase
MKRLKFGLLWFALFFVFNSFGQKPAFTNYSHKPDGEYFKSYITVSKKIITAPLRWNTKQYVIAGSVVAGGIIVYAFDDEIRKFFQRNHSDGLDFTSKYVFEPWGRGIYPALLIGGYYVYGLSTSNIRSRQIALGATQAFVMSGVSAVIIKHLAHRHRPDANMPPNPQLWDGPFKGFENTSFPSGHTITAFSLASYFSSVYNDKLWVGILSYGIASGVGLQRLYDAKHWSSDVFVGAALGIAIGKTVFHFLDQNSNLSLGLSDNGGISLVYRIK